MSHKHFRSTPHLNSFLQPAASKYAGRMVSVREIDTSVIRVQVWIHELLGLSSALAVNHPSYDVKMRVVRRDDAFSTIA